MQAPDFIKENFGSHRPWISLGIIVVLTILTIVFIVLYAKKDSECNACEKANPNWKPSSEKYTGPYDMNWGQTNWQYGSADAGLWGAVGRETTPIQASIYEPQWQHGAIFRASDPTQQVGVWGAPNGKREHATTGPGPAKAPAMPYSGMAPANACPPGSTPIYSPSGNQVFCQSNGSLPEGPPVACAKHWAPEASAEANALEAAGGLPPSTAYYGDRTLQRHMGNNPLTGGGGLSDAQLESLMHTGGAP